MALAEYQAQKDSSVTQLNPEPTVGLTVNHFEIARDAYLEFITYLSDLYGAKTSHLAEEKFLRAKENLDKKQHAFLTTEEIYEEYIKRVSQGPKPASRQLKPGYRMQRGDSYAAAGQDRPRQSQHENLMRGNSQAKLSTSPKPRRHQRLLRPQRSVQPLQQYFPRHSDLERESIEDFRITTQKRREQKDQRPRQRVEDFQDDDDEHSETQQQQELDEMSYEEEGDGNDYDSRGEQSIPVYTTGKSGQDVRHSNRRRR